MINTPEGKSGKWAEGVARQLLKGMGYYVLANSEIEPNGAPVIEGLKKNLVAPDITALKCGSGRLVEVKFKTAPVKYQKTGEFRCAVDKYCYDNYVEVEAATGWPLDLCFVIAKPGIEAAIEPVMYLQSLAVLKLCVIFGDYKNPAFRNGEAVYWLLDWFESTPLLASMIPENLEALCLRVVSHPWEKKSKDGHAPSMKDPQQGRFRF